MTTDTTPAARLTEMAKAAEALAAKATPGPWEAYSRDSSGRIDSDASSGLGWELDGPPGPRLRGQFGNGYDAILCAESRSLVPALARAVVVLTEALEDATEGLREMRSYVPDYFAEKWRHDNYITRADAALTAAARELEPTP